MRRTAPDGGLGGVTAGLSLGWPVGMGAACVCFWKRGIQPCTIPRPRTEVLHGGVQPSEAWPLPTPPGNAGPGGCAVQQVLGGLQLCCPIRWLPVTFHLLQRACHLVTENRFLEKSPGAVFPHLLAPMTEPAEGGREDRGARSQQQVQHRLVWTVNIFVKNVNFFSG